MKILFCFLFIYNNNVSHWRKNLKSVTEMAEYALEMNFFRRETLINNDLNQVADQQFSLQQWFAVGVQAYKIWFCYLLLKDYLFRTGRPNQSDRKCFAAELTAVSDHSETTLKV